MKKATSILENLALSLTIALSCVLSHAQTVNVTTWHNDNGRTGQNANETILTTSLVGDDTHFGKLCSASLDGRAYAQPLVVTNVKFKNQSPAKTIAYVATMNDSVYAIDGTNCAVLGQAALFPNGSGEVAVKTSEVGGTNIFGSTIGNSAACPSTAQLVPSMA